MPLADGGVHRSVGGCGGGPRVGLGRADGRGRRHGLRHLAAHLRQGWAVQVDPFKTRVESAFGDSA